MFKLEKDPKDAKSGLVFHGTTTACATCDGGGLVDGKSCEACKGTCTAGERPTKTKPMHAVAFVYMKKEDGSFHVFTYGPVREMLAWAEDYNIQRLTESTRLAREKLNELRALTGHSDLIDALAKKIEPPPAIVFEVTDADKANAILNDPNALAGMV